MQMTENFAEVIAQMTDDEKVRALVDSGAMTREDAEEYVSTS